MAAPVTGAVVPLSSAAPRFASARTAATDGAHWSGRLNRLLSMEIRAAAAVGLLTAAEADQLLARLVLVIDQAMSPAQP
jgi:hypothetical protein